MVGEKKVKPTVVFHFDSRSRYFGTNDEDNLRFICEAFSHFEKAKEWRIVRLGEIADYFGVPIPDDIRNREAVKKNLRSDYCVYGVSGIYSPCKEYIISIEYKEDKR